LETSLSIDVKYLHKAGYGKNNGFSKHIRNDIDVKVVYFLRHYRICLKEANKAGLELSTGYPQSEFLSEPVFSALPNHKKVFETAE